MDKRRLHLLACCPSSIGWLTMHQALFMNGLPLAIKALPVMVGMLASVWGLTSAIRIANVEDAKGGAWSFVGWSAIPCYAAMLSLCLFEQARVLSLSDSAQTLPMAVQMTSIAFGMGGMLTGMLTLWLAVISLPVLLATLAYIGFRNLIGRQK